VIVDQLELLRDGTVVETVAGTKATFDLSPEVDAWYTVRATGQTDMGPVYSGQTPWAMTNAIYVDLDGEGWTPPLPPLYLAH
jgi:hypothetical protein